MRSFGTVAGVTLLLTLAGIVQGDAAGRFDTKLAPDKRASFYKSTKATHEKRTKMLFEATAVGPADDTGTQENVD